MRNRLKCSLRILAAALLLAFALPASAAADAATSFEQANKLYEQGKFPEAAAAYEAIITGGETSPALYFNLANSLFRSGQLGQAIYYYRRAEDLAPRDPDIAANLQYARRQVNGGTPAESPWWVRYPGRLSVNEWTRLTTLAFWLWLAVLAGGEWRPQLKKPLRTWRLVTGAAVVLIGVGLGITAAQRLSRAQAVVVTHEAVVRYGPLAESRSYFNLRDGVEVTILDRKDEWLQVTDPIQRTGWVRADQIWVLSQDQRAFRETPVRTLSTLTPPKI